MKEKTSLTGLRELLIPGIMQYMTTVMLGFLVIHAGFLILFLNQKLTIMVVAEILSLISYVLLLYKLHYKITRYDTEVLSGLVTFVLVEVDLYMVVAAILMGEGCNFDNYVYGLLLITSFQFYISHNFKRDILLKVMIMASYLGVKICEMNYPPYYRDYSSWVVTFFTFVNPLIVTGATILFVIMVPILIFKYEDKLTQKASLDELTGLLNRSFLDKLHFDEEKYNLAMLDIDDFKQINDIYGHHNGDLILQDLGNRLKALEEKYDNTFVIRWGGEEFVVVYHVNNENNYVFLDIMEQLRREISESAVCIDYEQIVNYKATIGVAFHSEGDSYEELLKVADSRLYWGKQHGKNKVVFQENKF